MQLQVETQVYGKEAVGKGINNASKTATSYITNINDNGISIHPAGDTDNRIEITSNGTEIYQNDDSVAQYGATARIGKEDNSRFLIDADRLQAYDDNNNKYFEVSATSLSYGINTVASTDYVDNSISDSEDNLRDYVDNAIVDAVGEGTTGLKQYVDDHLEELQKQVDGAIDTWYYAADPLPDSEHPEQSNTPASNWDTDELKEAHLRDLYFNTLTGHTFRWAKENNIYKWILIEDTDATKALADAAIAQDTADGKRRVFVTQPVPPYDIGDLWTGGLEGDIKRCKIAKILGQVFADSDWELASKYTDDSNLIAFQTEVERDYATKIDVKTTTDGISQNVSKIKTKMAGMYAVSSTPADTINKTATITPALSNDEIWELTKGTIVTVKFTVANTVATPTLNINSTDAKPILNYMGSALSEAEYKWAAGTAFTFVYNGAAWMMQDSTVAVQINEAKTSINQTATSIESLASNQTEYIKPDGTTGTNLIQSAIKQNADNIALRVEKSGVIAAINASVEEEGGSAVQISADKVEIDGTAIFSAIQQNVSNTAQSAATTAVANKADKADAIQSVTTSTEYRLSDSATSLTDEDNIGYDWSTTIPTWSINKYLWIRVATEYTPITGSATTEYTPGIEANEWGIYDSQLTTALSTANTANMNANSAAANIITKQEYRLSDSDTSLVDSENIGYDWSTTIPTWSTNKYLWTRFKIEKTTVGNNSTVSYTPGIEQNQWGIYDSALTTALSTAAAAQATANNAAPKADAIKQEQRIYYRSKVGSPPPSGNGLPTAWITNNIDIWNENNTTSTEQREGYVKTGWTTKITPIAKSTGRFIRTQDTNVIQNKSYYQLVDGEYQLVTNPSNSNINNYYEAVDKYLYLWTCIQRQKVNGNIDYTDILLDDSTTVIDGGKIITGSIDANSINATSINAWGQLTVGAFTQEDQDAILNTEIDIDGVVGELLEETVKRVQRIYYRTNSDTAAPLTPGTTSSSWVTNGNNINNWTKYNTWSTRVPPIADSVDSTTKYLYLWTCIQTEVMQGDNPISYTDVLLDDSTTIIEGGRIATGSIAANKISVNNLSALNANMGTLTSGTIKYGTVGSNESFYLSNTDTSAQIGGQTSAVAGLRLTVGSGFGVTKNGKLYATGADISGAITASSGTIGGCSINNGVLEIAAANIKSGTIDSARIPNLTIDKITNLSTNLTTAGNTANSYIYYTASTGLILAGTNPSSATTNYVKLKAPGTGVTDAGVTIVGNNANYKTTINSDGMQIYAGDTTNPVSTFGTEITIGKKESNQLYTTISVEDFIVTSDNTIQAIRVSPGVDTIKEDFDLFDQPLPPRTPGTTRRTLANSIIDSITSGTSAYFMLENGNQRSKGTINLQTSGTTTRTITGTYAMTATLQVTRGTEYSTFTLSWSRTGTYEGPRVLVFFNASIVKPRLSFEGRSYFADSLFDSKRVYTNYDSSDGRGSLWLGRGYDEGDWTDNLGVFDSEASWLIRSDGTNVYSNMIYNASASTKEANVRVWTQDGDHGKLTRGVESSKRFKKNIEDIENVEALYSIPVRQFKYREDYLDSKDQRFDQIIPGFIAEELEEIYPICVDKNVDNQPENWNVRYLVPPMLKLIQNQKQEIEELKARIEVLEEK